MISSIIEIYNSHKNYYSKHLTNEQILFLNSLIYWTDNLKEQIYCIRYSIFTQPKCLYESCNNFANFKGMSEGYGLGGCCRKHGQFISNISKYGVRSVLSHKSTIDKIANTNYNRYGYINPMRNNIISTKMGETKRNYSDIQKREYLKKREITWQKNYGVSNIFEKTEYIKESIMLKYGVSNIAHAYEALGTSSLKKSKYKTFLWCTGEISKVQGYEHIALKELEESGYTFNDILTSKKDMPKIWYSYKSSIHRYYPDIFIPAENLIIEVKSVYTMRYDFYKNMLKAQACKNLGFNFKFIVL